MKEIKLEFVADIIAGPLLRELKKLASYSINSIDCDIDQHFQRLHAETQGDVIIFHTRPSFFLKEDDYKTRLIFLKDYLGLLALFAGRNKAKIILNTVEFNSTNMVGEEYFEGLEFFNLINSSIIQLSKQHQNIAIVDIASELAKVGIFNCLSIQNEMVMKLPYRSSSVKIIATAYNKIIDVIYAARKKVIALDADNTLWGGIIGEDGLLGINIDKSDYPGAIFWKFQEQLVELRNSGILLALVSKNNEQDVKEVFEKVKMPLAWDDFVTTRINWSPKSANIKEIAEELNVGIDSVIFIDDNPFEINEVKHSAPAVDCYHFDSTSPEIALQLLPQCSNLFTWGLTSEDLAKSKQYHEESLRKTLLKESTSLEIYLQSLEIKIIYGINESEQVKRISQLTNKTNQFNLTTKRYSEADIDSLMKIGSVYSFRVIDKYGDMGIVGVVIYIDRKIDTFLMSCRALGRQIEETMLKVVCDDQAENGLMADYVRTQKNQMVENFYGANGFELVNSDAVYKSYIYIDGPKPKFDILLERI
jgi:FkbH-like protein